MSSYHASTVSMRVTSLYASALRSRASPAALGFAQFTTRTNLTWGQSQTTFQPSIQPRTQTSPSSTSSAQAVAHLPPPWQVGDLRKEEAQIFEKLSPKYPDDLTLQERLQIEEIVGRRRALSQRLEQERGPNWYAITKRLGEIRDAKRQADQSGGITAIREWWARRKLEFEKDLKLRKNKLEQVAKARAASGEVTKKMAFREMAVYMERIRGEGWAGLLRERRQKEREFYDATNEKALAQALAEFEVQADASQTSQFDMEAGLEGPASPDAPSTPSV